MALRSATLWGITFTVRFTYEGSLGQLGFNLGFGTFFPVQIWLSIIFPEKHLASLAEIFWLCVLWLFKKRRINIFQKKHFWRKNMFLVNILIYCWETILMEQFQPAILTNCSARKKSSQKHFSHADFFTHQKNHTTHFHWFTHCWQH